MKESARLILFDIDGTLIRGGALWKECYERGFRSCVQGCGEIPDIGFAGKTDMQICRETLEYLNYSPEEIESLTPRIIEAYLAQARKEGHKRASEICVLPGVPRLLGTLQPDSRALMGLLTGNVKEGASLKLSLVGLDRFFTHESVGAWGDDHADRYELPSIAVRRAARKMGREFSGKEIVIIGDTVHDVNCGRTLGVRTIAVGTGRGIRKEDLLAQKPDFYFDDFSETGKVIEAIFTDL